MRYPLEKKMCMFAEHFVKQYQWWSVKKCGVSKCLRLNGWNNIMVLKHPRSLSLWSICLSACVYVCICSRAFQHSTYMFQPETSREVTPRIRNLHSQIPNTEFQRSCKRGGAGLLMSRAGESWNNSRQGSARRGEDAGAQLL